MNSCPNPLDVSNLQFKLQCCLKVFENKSFQSLPDQASLLTCANRYGLLFIGSVQNNFQVIQTKIVYNYSPNDKNKISYPKRIIDLASPPSHLCVNCDSTILAVVIDRFQCPTVLFYDVSSFITSELKIIKEIPLAPTPNTRIKQIDWNPTISSIFTACKTDGSLTVYDITPQSTGIHQLPPATNANCFCWSPKGKQLAVGGKDGKITQYKPDLTAVKTIPGPIFPAPYQLIHLQWVSNYQFIGVYQSTQPETQCSLVVVNAPKTGQTSYLDFQDICFSGRARPPQFFSIYQQAWNFIMYASANSTDIAVLANNNSEWIQWLMPDYGRAELPLSSDYQDTFPVGLAFDVSSTSPLPWNETYLPPCPLLCILSHQGVLCCFNVIYLKDSIPTICSASDTLALNFEGFTVAKVEETNNAILEPARVTTAATHIQSTSITQIVTPSVTVSTHSTTVSGTEPDKHTNTITTTIFTSIPPKITTGSSATITHTTQAVETEIIKNLPPPSNPALLSSNVGKFTDSVFSTSKPLLSSNTNFFESTNPSSSNVIFFPSNPTISSNANFASNNTPTQLFPTTSIPTTAPVISGPAELSAKASNLISKGGITITSINKNYPAFRENIPVTTEAPVTIVSKPSNVQQAPIGPLTTSASNPVKIELQETPLRTIAVSKDVGIPQPGGKTKHVDSSLFDIIQDDIIALDAEVIVMLQQTHLAKINMGSDQEKIDTIKGIDNIECFVKEAVEISGSQANDIFLLKQSLIQSWTWIEEARSHYKMFKNDALMMLLKLQPLDSMAEKKLNDIERLIHYIHLQIGDAHKMLDEKWCQFQEHAKKIYRMKTPKMETIFQTMTRHNAVIQKQTFVLKDLFEVMRNKILTIDSSQSQRKLFSKNVEYLTSDLQKMRLENPRIISEIQSEKIKERSEALTAEKSKKLRNLLKQRNIEQIKSSTTSISMSRTLTNRFATISSAVVTEPVSPIPKSSFIKESENLFFAPTQIAQMASVKLEPNLHSTLNESGFIPVSESNKLPVSSSISQPWLIGKTRVSSTVQPVKPSGLTYLIKEQPQATSSPAKPVQSSKHAVSSEVNLALTKTSASTVPFVTQATVKPQTSLTTVYTNAIPMFSMPQLPVIIPSVPTNAANAFPTTSVSLFKPLSTSNTTSTAIAPFNTALNISITKTVTVTTTSSVPEAVISTTKENKTSSRTTTTNVLNTQSTTSIFGSPSSIFIKPASTIQSSNIFGLAASTLIPSTASTSVATNILGPKSTTTKSTTPFTDNIQSAPAISTTQGIIISTPITSSNVNIFTTLAGTAPHTFDVQSLITTKPNTGSSFSSTTTASIFGVSPATITASNPKSTQSIFGVTTTSTTSIFGSPATAAHSESTTQNLFGIGITSSNSGSSTNIFASPSTTTSTPSIFGRPSSTIASTNIFGAPSSTSIITTSGSLGISATSASTTTTGSMFNRSASVSSPPVTSESNIFAKPVTTTTTTLANVLTTQANIFTTQPPTRNSNIFGTSTTTTASSIFGIQKSTSGSNLFATPATVTSSSNIFGTPASSSSSTLDPGIFGLNSSITITTTKSSIFGTPVSSSATSISTFGDVTITTTNANSSIFKSQTSTTGSSFFESTATTTITTAPINQSSNSLFGSAAPLFGQQITFGNKHSNAFGASQSGLVSAPVAASSNFGFGSLGIGTVTTTTTGSIFGGGTSFDSKNDNPFGKIDSKQQSFGSNIFGNIAASSTSTNIFASSPASTFGSACSTFGSTSQFGQKTTFGQSSTSAATGFGGSMFSPNIAAPTRTQTGLFSSGGGNASVSQTGFGSPATFQKPSGFGSAPIFGATAAATPAFGTTPSFGGAATFGSTPTFGSISPNSSVGFGGESAQQSQPSPGFANINTTNTVGFGNLAQQAQKPSSQSFSGASFSTWR